MKKISKEQGKKVNAGLGGGQRQRIMISSMDAQKASVGKIQGANDYTILVSGEDDNPVHIETGSLDKTRGPIGTIFAEQLEGSHEAQ